MKEPLCPRCGKAATHSTVIFQMGDAQCDRCNIAWKYWWDNKRPATGTVRELSK